MTCPYCEGRGCEECDETGKRYHEGFDVDGVTVMVSGSGDGLKPELREAFAMLAEAAFALPKPATLHVCPHCGRVFDSPSVCLESGEQTVPQPSTVPKGEPDA